MPRQVGANHIPGKDTWLFLGTEKGETLPSISLEVTESLSIGWQARQDILDCAIWCKGDPATPSSAAFLLESIDGFLWIHLFGANISGKDTLVYKSQDPILNSRFTKYIEFVWDYDTKVMTLYEDAVPVTILLDTSQGNYHTDPANFTTINSTSSELKFGIAPGKDNYQGEFFDAIGHSSARTALEISNYYTSISGATAPTPLGTIIFSSDRTGTFNMHTVSEDGSDPLIFETSVNYDYNPRYNQAGTEVIFYSTQGANTNNATDPEADPDSNLYGIPANSLERKWAIINSDASGRVGNLYPRTYEGSYNVSGWRYNVHEVSGNATNQFGIYRWNGFSLDNMNLGGGEQRYPDGHPTLTGSFIMILNRTQIWLCNDPGVGTTATYNTLLYSSSNNLSRCRYSPDGSKIIFTQEDGSGYLQVWVMDSDGNNEMQVTAGTSWHSRSCCFSPDSTKILYVSNETGSYQLTVANADGSGAVNISNNPFNDIEGDWKA